MRTEKLETKSWLARVIGRKAQERGDESPRVPRASEEQVPRNDRLCPICLAAFNEYAPYNRRKHARCPSCGSVERHRASWMFLRRETELLRRRVRMLHFAPERCLVEKIRRYPTVTHVGASYDPAKPNEGVDIQRMPYADASFDVIYCSHVLEHVPDDRRAMRELARVLSPQGVALILVPTRAADTTHEDESIVAPEERRKHFGQEDHLRAYGRDFVDRLEESGLACQVTYFSEEFSPEEQVRYGLVPEPMYVCRRGAS